MHKKLNNPPKQSIYTAKINNNNNYERLSTFPDVLYHQAQGNQYGPTNPSQKHRSTSLHRQIRVQRVIITA